ncbi:MAG: hypothetical protein OEW12_08925 [Deltaproteobacteria bacterium]|nr:hypothetical protein [Deltaproteobacteria bacterium]
MASNSPKEDGSKPAGRDLPEDFANRLATKIIVTNERERNPEEATFKVASLILRTLGVNNRQSYFIETSEILLAEEETQRYAAVAWASILMEREHIPGCDAFISHTLDIVIDEHMNLAKPLYEMEMRRKKFSHYAWLMGEVFINMMRVSSDLYEVLSQLYGHIIRKEMALELKNAEEKDTKRRIIIGSQREKETASKKLFDDTLDYINTRGEFKSDSLNQQNPNEFIAVLTDRLRGTRRYVIQDIVNKQALDRKKQAEKELSEKQAGAEEIIRAKEPFKKALALFLTEKRYNFKYLSVEKVRVTIQVMSIITGIFYFLAGYLGIQGMHWVEGIMIGLGMYLFARFAASRASFKRFYPYDVSKELETVVGQITPVLRKMAKEQMGPFVTRQVKDKANLQLLPVMPEFIKYLFAVMPDRRNMIISYEELQEVMDELEMDVARQLRDTHYFQQHSPHLH